MANRKKAPMWRINCAYRNATGARNLTGVKLTDKCATILRHHDQPIPGTRAERVKATVALLDAISAGSKPRASSLPKQNQTATKSVSGDDFYRSWAWKRLRYDALKLNGRRCQCCGWQPGDTEHGHLVVDHIKPRRRFPELELKLSNLQVLCNDCNMGKSSVYEDDYRTMDQKHFATIQ